MLQYSRAEVLGMNNLPCLKVPHQCMVMEHHGIHKQEVHPSKHEDQTAMSCQVIHRQLKPQI